MNTFFAKNDPLDDLDVGVSGWGGRPSVKRSLEVLLANTQKTLDCQDLMVIWNRMRPYLSACCSLPLKLPSMWARKWMVFGACFCKQVSGP